MKSSVNIRYIVNGKDAQRMWLVPSASFIVRSTSDGGHTYAPDTISCRVIRQVGSQEAEELSTGYTLKYRYNASGNGTEVVSGQSVAVHPDGAADTNTVDFSLLNSNGVEVDRFTARVVDAGANGLSPDYTVYRFKQSTTIPSKPTGTDQNPQGWSDRCDNPQDTKTPWWMSMALVSGATGRVTGDWSYPVQVTGEDGQAGAYSSYVFAKNTTPHTAPSTAVVDSEHGWYDAPPTLSRGEYCWMTFARFKGDGSMDDDWSTPIRITPLPAVDYVLELSCDAVQITPEANGNAAFASPSTISATVWKVTDGERTDVTSSSTIEYIIFRQNSNVGAVKNYTGAVAIPTNDASIGFTLYSDFTKSKAIGRKSVSVSTLVQGPPGDSQEAIKGDDGVIKWLDLVPSVVTRQLDGTYSPSTVTAKCMMRIGNGDAVWVEAEDVSIYLGTDTEMTTEIHSTQSYDPITVSQVLGNNNASSLIFAADGYGTATLTIQRLVKPGVVRCREWGKGVSKKIFLGFGSDLDTVYDYQDGNETEYLDVVKKDGIYYMCKKSFRVILGRNEVMNEKYVPGGSGNWDTYWQLASFASFAAFDLILTSKAKVKNLYVDEIVIPEVDFQGLDIPGKYAMVANKKGIHMTGTITAQSMSLDVATPANGDLLVAPLNIVDAEAKAVAAGSDKIITLCLPCLAPGTTRQIDILVVGEASEDKQWHTYKLRLLGSISNGNTSRPMNRGQQSDDVNYLEFRGNQENFTVVHGEGTLRNPATNILGLYRCIGYCLKNSTNTWWECIRLNDGTEAKSGFDNVAIPVPEHQDSVNQQDTPMTEGQFIKGSTIHNSITSLN